MSIENENLENAEVDYKAEFERLQTENQSLRTEKDKFKSSFDKVASEAANYKKQLTEQMTDDAKIQSQLAEREEHYKALERENSIIKTKQKLSESISDTKLLDELSSLYADGKTMEALDKQNAYFASQKVEMEKQIKADLLKTNPITKPDNANGNNGITKEQFDKMSYTQKTELYNKDKELYDKLTKK